MAKIRKHQGHLVIDWRDSNGKRHFERVPGDDKGKAKRRLGEILKSGEKAITDETFEEYAQDWLQDKKAELELSTYLEYESVLKKHFYPVIGHEPFSKITKPMIRKIISAKRAEGYSNGTVRNMLAPVRAMYNQAIDDGEPIANPAAKLGVQKRYESKIDPYNREEVSAMLQKALALIPHYYPLFLCAVRTGMRQSELIALRPSDIDYEKGLIHVQRALSRGVLKTTKSRKPRWVDMSKQLSGVLHEMGRKGEEWQFQTPGGTQLDRHNLGKVWRQFLKDAKLRPIPFKNLRHSFASIHIASNQSLAYIRDQLGHSSIEITVNIYGHLVPGYKRSVADTLDD